MFRKSLASQVCFLKIRLAPRRSWTNNWFLKLPLQSLRQWNLRWKKSTFKHPKWIFAQTVFVSRWNSLAIVLYRFWHFWWTFFADRGIAFLKPIFSQKGAHTKVQFSSHLWSAVCVHGTHPTVQVTSENIFLLQSHKMQIKRQKGQRN